MKGGNRVEPDDIMALMGLAVDLTCNKMHSLQGSSYSTVCELRGFWTFISVLLAGAPMLSQQFRSFIWYCTRVAGGCGLAANVQPLAF